MARDLRYLVLAEGQFGPMTSKTASGCIRYSPERVVAVLDSRHAGRTASQVIGDGGDIPVVASVEDGLWHAPNALLIGIAPTGGRLPEAWRDIMRSAIGRATRVRGPSEWGPPVLSGGGRPAARAMECAAPRSSDDGRLTRISYRAGADRWSA